MLNRMLLLLGGVLAAGALVVAPAAATAAAPSAAAAADDCNDQYPPYSHFDHGWYGHDNDGPYWRGWDDGHGDIYGTSWDGSCNQSDRLGKVDHVMVAVQRMRGDRCQHLNGHGRLGDRTRACAHPHWLRAKGAEQWTAPHLPPAAARALQGPSARRRRGRQPREAPQPARLDPLTERAVDDPPRPGRTSVYGADTLGRAAR